MCGIAGWFGDSKQAQAEAVHCLKLMGDSIAHRGPDGEGQMAKDGVGLAHRRLSIIDIESGAQPMTSRDQELTIVFNGEIYNFRELRNQLQSLGADFASHSDTEVILWAYRIWGTEGFQRLRGMFAFALWDSAKRHGFLFRDWLGIKPLFYSLDRGIVLFASEAKAIHRFWQVQGDASRGRPNLASLHLVMNFRYLPTLDSMFEDISQLAPGTLLQWSDDSNLVVRKLQHDVGAASADTFSALQDSVSAHMVADVPVGAYLSGGIDSATIAMLMKSASAVDFPTYTLRLGDDPLEAENAAASAQMLNLQNRQQEIEFSIEGDLKRLLWHLEVPKINSLQVNALARVASREVKVVLSGLGGDELFYGYNAYKIFHRLQALSSRVGKLTAPVANALAKTVGLAEPGWRESQRLLLMLACQSDWSRAYGLLRNVWDSPKQRRLLYGERMLAADLPDAFETIAQLWPDQDDPVAACREFEWRTKMVNDLLWQEDRCSMAEGLEVRVPFVDPLLKESADTIPRFRHMASGGLKQHMRAVLHDRLPAQILGRRKSGFQVDSPAFFDRQLRPIAAHYLSREEINRHGLFNPDYIGTLLSLPTRKRFRWHFFVLYLVLLTHLWFDVFETNNANNA